MGSDFLIVLEKFTIIFTSELFSVTVNTFLLSTQSTLRRQHCTKQWHLDTVQIEKDLVVSQTYTLSHVTLRT